jgi:hypothetical protein
MRHPRRSLQDRAVVATSLSRYVWETREDIERFMKTELWQGILNKLGKELGHGDGKKVKQ